MLMPPRVLCWTRRVKAEQNTNLIDVEVKQEPQEHEPHREVHRHHQVPGLRHFHYPAPHLSPSYEPHLNSQSGTEMRIKQTTPLTPPTLPFLQMKKHINLPAPASLPQISPQMSRTQQPTTPANKTTKNNAASTEKSALRPASCSNLQREMEKRDQILSRSVMPPILSAVEWRRRSVRHGP